MRHRAKERKVLEKMKIIRVIFLPFVLVFLLSLVVPVLAATRSEETKGVLVR